MLQMHYGAKMDKMKEWIPTERNLTFYSSHIWLENFIKIHS